MATSARTDKKAFSGGPFTFIKSRGSIRKELKRQHSNGEDGGSGPGALGRWLRDLRPAASKPPAPPAPPIDRAHPVYHSEGKGLRKRKDRDRRRHSFNEQQQAVLTVPPAQSATKSAGTYRTDGQSDSACARQMARDVAAPSNVMMAAHANNNNNNNHHHHQHQQATAVQGHNHHTQPSSLQGHSQPSHHQSQAALHASKGASIYSYLHNQSGLNFAPVVHQQHWDQQQQQQQYSRNDTGSPPPTPPVRDASSLKGVKYGPGHEKFPSWPMSAAAEPTPPSLATPGGGSHRSKSWTDHTNYPKEKGISYTRPYMKRPNTAFTQQLKTVMERCEKIPPETYESRSDILEKDNQSRMYLPRVDREGKVLGDMDYMVPSPPERDVVMMKQHLTQADLEEYARSYQDPQLTQVELEEYAMTYQDPKPSPPHLTQADLEEYSRTYEEALQPQHQHQPSYAQSEGYHSYVSSTDSTLATPFLDRLRRDSEAVATSRAVPGPQTPWNDEDRAGRDSVVTTSSGSASSSETLKWHGSMSDVSVASSSFTHQQGSSRQLIAHSAKVQTPQRHNSESVLFPAGGSGWQSRVQRNNHHNKLRLFPVNTYSVQPELQRALPVSPTSPQLTVAERISELERQQTRYTYLDPDKRHRVSDPTLKAIQKKALLSFYERHHTTNSSGRNQAWRSEPQLAQPAMTLAPTPQSPPPQPPPRPRSNQASRRASSASDYASGAWRDKVVNRTEKVIPEVGTIKDGPRHQHSNSCGSLSTDLLGPLIVGPSISLDDWVPERPPKKPHLRSAFPPPLPDRMASPDLPPPSPPTVLEDEVFASDEPLPPPPPEVNSDWTHERPEKRSSILKNCEKPLESTGLKHIENSNSSQRPIENGVSHRHNGSISERHPSLPTSPNISPTLSAPAKSVVLTEKSSIPRKSPSPTKKSPTSPTSRNMNQTFVRTLSMKRLDNVSQPNPGCGVPPMIPVDKNWSALRYQTQKLMVNGKIATSFPVQDGAERMEHRNGSVLVPSKARLQRIPQEMQNGALHSRSPPHSNLNLRPNLKHSNESRQHSQRSPTDQEKKARPQLSRSDSTSRSPPTERLQPGDGERRRSPPGDALQPDSERRRSPPTRLELEDGSKADIVSTSQLDTTQELRENTNHTSTSKASYLANRRDRDVPNFEGSYKRTMSPSEVGLDNHKQSDCDRLPSTATGIVSVVTNAKVPVIANGGKLSPSHHNQQHAVIKERIVIPSVIDKERIVTNEPTVVQRLTTTNNKQTFKFESVCLNNDEIKESCEDVKEKLDEQKDSDDCVINVQTPLRGIEIQTQCDMHKVEVQCNIDNSVSSGPRSPVFESLTLVQRSEVVLHVNAPTSDASSQTEREAVETEAVTTPPSVPVRQKLQEEIECERLSMDLASQLSPLDKLQGILVPAPDHKKPADYVAGLFRLEIGSRSRSNGSSVKSQSPTDVGPTADVSEASPTNKQPPVDPTARQADANSTTRQSQTEVKSDVGGPLPFSSVYFATSESKAKFLTQYGGDMTSQSEQLSGLKDNKDLQQKKEELMSRLTRKLEVLRDEHVVVAEEARVNEELGGLVATQVASLARPHEAAKYRLHVEEVGKITSLLLGLSGRLARVENALMGMPEQHSERKILESKRDKLKDQLEEAKKLKENIDRRSVFVSNILYKYFNSEEYADYDHFINMKAKLIMESREILDKIKLGEEQLTALKDTLSSSDS